MDFLKEISPREYQTKILKSCIENNCLVVLPTGLGKTLIAILLTIERMKAFPGEKVVLLAPTKPLAEQHLASFKKHLPELFGDIQIFTGQINAENRKKIWRTADIILSTPQCVANDLKNKLYNLEEVCLLIQDEAHRCVKNYDYNLVAKLYKLQGKNKRILGLTASPGSETQKIKEICRNLSIEKVELRTRESPDVKPYLQERKFEKIIVDFPSEFSEMKYLLQKIFNKYIEELRYRKVLFGPTSKIGLINLQKKISSTIARGNKNYNYFLGASACAQAIKIQHAIELLETQTLEGFFNYLKNLSEQSAKKQSKGVVKLVSQPEFNFIYSQTNELLIKNKEHPKIQKLIDIVKKEKKDNKNFKTIIFAQFRDTTSVIAKKLNELEKTNAKIFIGQSKKGKTEKGMSQKEQKKIIEEFKEGKIDCLVSTTIGEEGIDIPDVDAVIFYEPVPSAIRAIQRAGRTARLTKGKLIIMITKNTKDETSFFISRAREKKMETSIGKVEAELSSGIKIEIQKKL